MRALKIKRCTLPQCLAHFLSSSSYDLLAWSCNQPLKKTVGDRLKALDDWIKWNQYWNHLVFNLKQCAIVPLLLCCLSVFLSESISSLHSGWLFHPSILRRSFPHSACSPSPFLIFSHFQSNLSALHSYQSILAQINLLVQARLSGSITFLSYQFYTTFFSHDCIPFFCILSVSLASLALPNRWKFFFLL